MLYRLTIGVKSRMQTGRDVNGDKLTQKSHAGFGVRRYPRGMFSSEAAPDLLPYAPIAPIYLLLLAIGVYASWWCIGRWRWRPVTTSVSKKYENMVNSHPLNRRYVAHFMDADSAKTRIARLAAPDSMDSALRTKAQELFIRCVDRY